MSLEEDYLLPTGQVYGLVSFVGPTQPQKNNQLGMKIRGVFATKSEAEAHVKKLQKMEETSMDIYLVELGKWLLIPPDASKIADQRFQEEKLDEMMTGYREMQERARQEFNKRKAEVKEKGLDTVEGVGGSKPIVTIEEAAVDK